MPRRQPTPEQLRAQIEALTSERFPTDTIEQRIAASLLSKGHFRGRIEASELALILRHIVYTLFAQQKVAGFDVGLVHNIPFINVTINDSQADVRFTVHIHRPIIAFLKFKYSLVNDPPEGGEKLRVKKGTLVVKRHTRRFDIKAKAALATIDVDSITRKELGDLSSVIIRTLPPQLKRHGVQGKLASVGLELLEGSLLVCLQGKFRPLAGESN